MSKQSKSEPLRNTVYDNVPVEMEDPDSATPGFCEIDEDTGSAEMDEDIGPAESDMFDHLAEFLRGVTKEQWLWAGGIGLGIIILKNRKQ